MRRGRNLSRADFLDHQAITEPMRLMTKKHCLIMGLLLLIVMVTTRLSAVIFLRGNDVSGVVEITTSTEYAIMGDMGSSGSRVYVFSYKQGQKHKIACSTGIGGEYEGLALIDNFEYLASPHKAKLNEKKPGIDSIRFPYNATEYFSGLIQFAKSVIPQEKHRETPFFMFATAGMRVLARDNDEKIFDDDEFDSNAILEEDDDNWNVGRVADTLQGIRRAIHNSPFLFADENVRVLTGEEEAFYDWASLQQTLHNGDRNITRDNSFVLSPGAPATDGAYPMAIIDTGGASSQIAYSPQQEEASNVAKQIFGAEESKIVARSFLGYGMYASRSVIEEVVAKKCAEDEKCDLTVTHPCFSYNHTHSTGYGGKKYILEGGGDFEACYELILEYFDLSVCDTSQGKCGIHGASLPEPRKGTKFLGIDNVNRVAEFYGHQGPASLTALENDVKDFCALEWNEALRVHESHSNEFRIKKYCYEGVYTLVLLHHGYQFPMDTKDLIFTDYLGSKHINWPLGAMASELNRMCNSPNKFR